MSYLNATASDGASSRAALRVKSPCIITSWFERTVTKLFLCLSIKYHWRVSNFFVLLSLFIPVGYSLIPAALNFFPFIIACSTLLVDNLDFMYLHI